MSKLGRYVVGVLGGRVVTSRMPSTLLESKERVQACVVHHDPSTLQAEHAYLVKVHGVWITKVINAWVAEAVRGEIGKAPEYSA